MWTSCDVNKRGWWVLCHKWKLQIQTRSRKMLHQNPPISLPCNDLRTKVKVNWKSVSRNSITWPYMCEENIPRRQYDRSPEVFCTGQVPGLIMARHYTLSPNLLGKLDWLRGPLDGGWKHGAIYATAWSRPTLGSARAGHGLLHSQWQKLHSATLQHGTIQTLFSPRTVIDWNHLDNNTVHSDSTECFKSALALAKRW